MTAEAFKGNFSPNLMCEESYEAINEEGKVIIKPLKKKKTNKSKEVTHAKQTTNPRGNKKP